MIIVRLLIALCVAGLSGLAAAMPPAIYVVRHLHTTPGLPDPDLLPQGRRVAASLPGWFAGKPLGAIYVTDFKRTRQTAAPLATARKMGVKVYAGPDTPGLVARVRAETGPVLIVGHSNTVPGIVEALTGANPGPITLDRFGDIWTVTPRGLSHAVLPGAR